jgi:hypothetical protein
VEAVEAVAVEAVAAAAVQPMSAAAADILAVGGAAAVVGVEAAAAAAEPGFGPLDQRLLLTGIIPNGAPFRSPIPPGN